MGRTLDSDKDPENLEEDEDPSDIKMPLLQFLNSSLNVELVYIILKSITEFAKAKSMTSLLVSSTSTDSELIEM
jgi:hypothetical protein